MSRGETPELASFQRIVFFTGAGLSAESGVPTYRGSGGIWQRYHYEDYACQRAFDRDPARVWAFHDERRAQVAACEPNAAHRLIARIQREKPGTRIVTQNIDGLHQRAGAGAVLELHGSLWRMRCSREGRLIEDHSVPLATHHCECGAWLRPDLVWFEDALDPDVFQAAADAIISCDCFLSIGTSGLVYPAAGLPRVAKYAGAFTIEINPEDTPLSSSFDACLRGTACEALLPLYP